MVVRTLIVFALLISVHSFESPITSDFRESLIDRTNHSRHLLSSNDWTYITVDNFQFGAVPFPVEGDTQIYDITQLNYSRYEDSLLLEGWWLFIIIIGVIIVSLVWYLARPCLGGVRGTRGCLCPKAFVKAKGEGYSYVHVKMCQMCTLVWVLAVSIVILITFMYNSALAADMKAVDESSKSVVTAVDRNIRLINNAFYAIPFSSYETVFNASMKLVQKMEVEIKTNVGGFGDYTKKYNKTREGLTLFGLYVTSFMLVLLVFATCTMHYQMSSGISIFGWFLASVLLFSAAVTYPLNVSVSDACLVGDNILNSKNYEEQSIVLHFFPINDPAILQIRDLFNVTFRTQIVDEMNEFLKKNCGSNLLCPTDRTVTLDNYMNFKYVPFITGSLLYSSEVCQTKCIEPYMQDLAKKYTAYFNQMNIIDDVVYGPIESIRHGTPFINYVYSVMKFMCTDDIFFYVTVMTALLCLSGILTFLLSIVSMITGKRFNMHNKARPTQKELEFRGSPNQFELPNFDFFDY
ncbi:hypothetical protein EIN_065740 [Entamoeba invadens IP1]|uniref:Uncharacterized protein n=1 Tax=Entamoeba invadens IP1 TaxID=370355 RepID=A0A0A1TVB0_ENTIV|nr:hypothetical protein EIN_065740 [Entamoeba invadens IP1]ELP84299.1 hypothetical protein EIN_065740 [Entamoeba invadens IP1]|eukprot:XP_004183645.1 hypothetical protein EIN_065740 [Entamoeba invadens IP1]